ITTEATVPEGLVATGTFLAKAPLVLAGIDVALAVLRLTCDGRLVVTSALPDGTRAEPGTVLATVQGPARGLLTGERTALNLVQRLSGIATATREYVDTAAGRLEVLDTRKTTPLLRALEKYAVRVGGGRNHRFGLFDQILIKENHARIAGGVRRAIEAARQYKPGMVVEVEAQSVEEAEEAASAGADIILLDNLTTPEIREAIRRIAGRARVEISGNVTLARMPELATTGADFVSIGALTHSVRAADISFEITTTGERA
ncbi:MAG TPA: carboxylating nicotinate-nucleotide diphosphorylase, partial [Vicinamibacterales bacterium]